MQEDKNRFLVKKNVEIISLPSRHRLDYQLNMDESDANQYR